MAKIMRFSAIKLSVIMILIFLAQIFFPGLTELFLLAPEAITELQLWRFITAIFLHGGLTHLLLNLFALFLFGTFLEKFVGSNKFLAVFFVSGILANAITVFFYSSSLGASGAIFGIIGALIFVKPMLPVFAFGMPLPIFVAGILWAIGDILGTYGFLTGNPIDNTGNIAHLSGMFFGFLFGYFYRKAIRRKRKRRDVSLDENEIRIWEDAHMR